MQPTFDEVKDNDKIRYFTLYRRKMCKISHFSTIECDFCSKRDYLSRFHYLPFFVCLTFLDKKIGAKSTRIVIMVLQRKMQFFLVVSKIFHIFATLIMYARFLWAT